VYGEKEEKIEKVEETDAYKENIGTEGKVAEHRKRQEMSEGKKETDKAFILCVENDRRRRSREIQGKEEK